MLHARPRAFTPFVAPTLTPASMTLATGRFWWSTESGIVLGTSPDISTWTDQFNAIELDLDGGTFQAPHLSSQLIGTLDTVDFEADAQNSLESPATSAMDDHWSSGTGPFGIGVLGRVDTTPSANAVIVDGGQLRINGGWAFHLLSDGRLRLVHERSGDDTAWVANTTETWAAGDFICVWMEWDGDITASNVNGRYYDNQTGLFADLSFTVTPTTGTIGTDSGTAKRIGSYGTFNAFTGEIFAVWGMSDCDSQTFPTPEQVMESYARFFLAGGQQSGTGGSDPDGGVDPGGGGSGSSGSGIPTPRQNPQTWLDAIPPNFFVGQTYQKQDDQFSATYIRNIEENHNSMVAGSPMKPRVWSTGLNSASVTATGQGSAIGSLQEFINYKNARGIIHTPWHYLGVWYAQMANAMLSGTNAGNFQSRLQSVIGAIVAVPAARALMNERIDLVNELFNAREAANYNRRLFSDRPEFQVMTANGGDTDFLATLFQNVRQLLPDGQLGVNDVSQTNGSLYGTATTPSQLGTANSVRACRQRTAVQAVINDLISRGIQVDVWGEQAHLAGGDFIDFQNLQHLCAEFAQRGCRPELTEVDLSRPGQGRSGNLNATELSRKLARLIRVWYNSNALSNAVIFWKNPEGFLPNEYFQSGTGRLAFWYEIVKNEGLAEIYPLSDRPNKGIWGRRLVDEWITNQTGSGWVRSGGFGRSLANLQGSLSTDGQFDVRTGLRLLSGRTLYTPWTYFTRPSGVGGGEFISRTAFALSIEFKRQGSGNGNPIIRLYEDASNTIDVIVTGTQIRIEADDGGSPAVTSTTLAKTFSDGEERRLAMSVSATGIVVAVTDTLNSSATTTTLPLLGGRTMPQPARIYVGGDDSGNVSNWRLGYVALYEGTRSQTILEERAAKQWGDEDTLRMIDPESFAGGGTGSTSAPTTPDPGTFTPDTRSGLVGWYDPDDASFVDLSGSDINELQSKKETGVPFVVDLVEAPAFTSALDEPTLLSAEINSRDVADFDVAGTKVGLGQQGSDTTRNFWAAGAYMAGIIRVDSDPTGDHAIWDQAFGTTDTARGWRLSVVLGGAGSGTFRLTFKHRFTTGTDQYLNQTNDLTVGTTYLFVFSWGGDPTNAGTFRINGAANLGSTTLPSGTLGNDTSINIFVGNRHDANEKFPGVLGEFYLVRGVPTDITLDEAYLASRWGITLA
jgi:GH35 family endo-1,4-beta-xylanase